MKHPHYSVSFPPFSLKDINEYIILSMIHIHQRGDVAPYIAEKDRRKKATFFPFAVRGLYDLITFIGYDAPKLTIINIPNNSDISLTMPLFTAKLFRVFPAPARQVVLFLLPQAAVYLQDFPM